MLLCCCCFLRWPVMLLLFCRCFVFEIRAASCNAIALATPDMCKRNRNARRGDSSGVELHLCHQWWRSSSHACGLPRSGSVGLPIFGWHDGQWVISCQKQSQGPAKNAEKTVNYAGRTHSHNPIMPVLMPHTSWFAAGWAWDCATRDGLPLGAAGGQGFSFTLTLYV